MSREKANEDSWWPASKGKWSCPVWGGLLICIENGTKRRKGSGRGYGKYQGEDYPGVGSKIMLIEERVSREDV